MLTDTVTGNPFDTGLVQLHRRVLVSSGTIGLQFPYLPTTD